MKYKVPPYIQLMYVQVPMDIWVVLAGVDANHTLIHVTVCLAHCRPNPMGLNQVNALDFIAARGFCVFVGYKTINIVIRPNLIPYK
jgi:hypothetical protein